MIHLATGLALRNGRVLLVASRYVNHSQPLWNLPGGRQQPGELLAETVAREIFEETKLRPTVGPLLYVSESYDAELHFLNATFLVEVDSFDGQPVPHAPSNDHIVAVEWVALSAIAERITVAVVREPLLAYLEGSLLTRYAGFRHAGVTIEWPPDSA